MGWRISRFREDVASDVDGMECRAASRGFGMGVVLKKEDKDLEHQVDRNRFAGMHTRKRTFGINGILLHKGEDESEKELYDEELIVVGILRLFWTLEKEVKELQLKMRAIGCEER